MSEASPLLPVSSADNGTPASKTARTNFAAPSNVLTSFGVVQLLLVVGFLLFTRTNTTAEASFLLSGARERYQFMMHVSIMIFIGFGYLMTFLRKHGYSAVGFTFLVSVMTIELTMLLYPVIAMVHKNDFHTIDVDVTLIIEGLFASAAVMISFGALLGKVSPGQMLFLALAEVVFYCLNIWVGEVELKAVDMGGSIFIHTFGAYFGLAASLAMRRVTAANQDSPYFAEETNAYYSDLFSFIGTVFLWIYWPSFNGAVADQQNQVFTTVNTFVSLCASCVVTFFLSRILRDGTFDTADIQNATLAGGVAIGTVSNMPISPGVAMVVGTIAGTVSILGFRFLQTKLQDSLGLHDTCGVHNLHGMPGIVGGIVSAIVVAAGDGPHYQDSKAGAQIAGLAITLGIASVSGYICGLVASKIFPSAEIGFNDAVYWAVPVAETAFTAADSNAVSITVPMRNSHATKQWDRLRSVIKSGLLKRALSGRQAE